VAFCCPSSASESTQPCSVTIPGAFSAATVNASLSLTLAPALSFPICQVTTSVAAMQLLLSHPRFSRPESPIAPSSPGTVIAAIAPATAPGPWLVTVRLQVTAVPASASAGQDSRAARSARPASPWPVPTVNGPAVTDPARLAAVTEYVNDPFPGGTIPDTMPVAWLMDSHDGAPSPSE